jgi:broad specificity phosphatase PhoE
MPPKASRTLDGFQNVSEKQLPRPELYVSKPLGKTPPTDMAQMYLVRHGATSANEPPYVLQGQHADNQLNENGLDQARRAATFLSEFPVDRIYASPLVRAFETAKTIAEPHGIDVEPVKEILEADVGEWEGLGWDAIVGDHAEEYTRFMSDPGKHSYRGGESYSDVLARVRPAFDRLLSENLGKVIVVVAHNVVNRVYLADLLGLYVGQAKELKQNNCCVNVVRFRKGRTQLITMNAAFHLMG